MPRRRFCAELQYQNQLAAKRQAQAERAAGRQFAAAQREAEQARRRAERARAQEARASAAQQKEAEREAKRLHEEAMLAEVESLNAQLAQTYDEIDSILSATLAVDDYVDLERLRTVAEHPPFSRLDLEVPTPPPAPVPTPREPLFVEPEEPKGLGGLFGKKRHAEAISAAQAKFAEDHRSWEAEVAAVANRQQELMREHAATEEGRIAELQRARAEYERESEAREAAAVEANQKLDVLIAGLGAGVDSAIQEYVSIVLSNSVFPEAFPVQHEFEFDADLEELRLTVLVPRPDALPMVREYKYVKAKDTITEIALPQKDVTNRYSDAVYKTALRSLHEIFESDRAGHINTIALTVACNALDPATGLERRVPLVAVGVERASFTTFDLSNIVPLATLRHIGASVSKNPYELIAIDETQGVRGR